MSLEEYNNNLKLRSAFREILLLKNISDDDMEILPDDSTSPLGFTSTLVGVQVISKNKNSEMKILHLITKCLSGDKMYKEKFGLAEMFQLELHMYERVFPAYENLQVENGLIPLKMYPLFYHAYDETIIMENIASEGFRHSQEFILDNDHLELTILELGRFHAISFALKEKQSHIFEEVAPRNKLYFEIYQKFLKENVYNLCRKSVSLLNSDTDSEAIERFGSYVANIDLFFTILKNSLNNKCFIIIHGDLKSINMMFKYEDQNQPMKPTQVCFFDFQTSAVGPPVIDLIVLLYTNLTADKYEKLEYYLLLYYESLSKHLEKFNCDCSKLYPYDVLKEQWRAFAIFGLIPNQAIAQMESLKKINVLDLITSESDSSYKFSFLDTKLNGNNEIYKAIVKPLILHLFKNNFI